MLRTILHMEWKISKCWLCAFTGVDKDHRVEQNVLFFNCGPMGRDGRFSGSPSERHLEQARTGASSWPSTVCSSADGTDFRGLSCPGVSFDTVSGRLSYITSNFRCLSASRRLSLSQLQGEHRGMCRISTITKGSPRQERSPVSYGNTEPKLSDKTLNRNVT